MNSNARRVTTKNAIAQKHGDREVRWVGERYGIGKDARFNSKTYA